MSDPRQSRIRATLWTDANGRYEFATVQPAHYADVNPPPPMHIHVHLEPRGLPDHWVDSYYFDGDKYLRPQDIEKARGLGPLSNIVRLTRGRGGELHATRDFRVNAALAERNRLVNGWYRS